MIWTEHNKGKLGSVSAECHFVTFVIYRCQVKPMLLWGVEDTFDAIDVITLKTFYFIVHKNTHFVPAFLLLFP